jgi:putative colanic acid biosynthesis acetyltransferase WcaF
MAEREFAANAGPQTDPTLRPAFTASDRLYRLVWNLAWLLLYRPSPRPLHAWRSMLLRLFGAQMGPGDGAEIYNPSLITMGSHAIVSQNAYLCGATHDYEDPAFPLYSMPITLGAYSWVAARACVSPGVTLGDGAILGLASVATRDLEPWSIYAGNPARKIKDRARRAA